MLIAPKPVQRFEATYKLFNNFFKMVTLMSGNEPDVNFYPYLFIAFALPDSLCVINFMFETSPL